MTQVLSTALSGLTAQAKKLEVSASNVANVRSLGVQPGSSQAQPGEFVPQQTALISTAGGGVRAEAVPVSPASVLSYEPGAPGADGNGLVARPNVSLEQEIVTQIEAQRAFEANLRVIEAEDELLGELLDIRS